MSDGHDGIAGHNSCPSHSREGSQRAQEARIPVFTSAAQPYDLTGLSKGVHQTPSAALTPRPLEGAFLVLVWFGFLRQELMVARLPSYVAEDGVDFRHLPLPNES